MTDFVPFYERWARRMGGAVAGAFVFSFALAAAVLFLHRLTTGPLAFRDSSLWLVALIGTAMLLVIYATAVLRELALGIRARAGEETAGRFTSSLHTRLSDARIVRAGLAFGALNAVVGWLFGLPYPSPASNATILIGWVVAGSVCGIAVYGIHAVRKALRETFDGGDALDFTSPDRCGGTAYLGDALVIFSFVTLVAGVLISIYILKTWPRADAWVKAVQWIWIAFPYLAAAWALSPALDLHRRLTAYKQAHEERLRLRIIELRRTLERPDAAAKELRDSLAFHESDRTKLYAMRTWPFDLEGQVKLISAVATSLTASVNYVSEWIA